MPGWFMQNFLFLMKPKKIANNKYVLGKILPTASSATCLPLIDIEDTGKYLAPAIENPEKYNHTNLFASTACYSLAKICEVWTQYTGMQVMFDSDVDEHENLSEAQKEVLSEEPSIYPAAYYGVKGEEGVNWTIAQIPEKLTSWEEFVQAHEPWFS